MRANWIFRIAPIPPAPDCMRSRRLALYALALIPGWIAAAVLSFSLWPWQIAAKHCLVLALLAVVFGEAGLIGIQRLPFTCSYLPGRSNFNMTFLLCTGTVLTSITKAAQFERAAFENPRSYLAIVCVVAAIGASLFLRNTVFSRSPEGALHFEDAGDKVIEGLGLNKDGVTLTTS